MNRSVFLLKRAHFQIRRAMDEQLAAYNLTAAQLEVLGPVVMHTDPHGLEHRALLEWLEVSSPTLTNLIDGLVERGLIERRISPEDARVKRLHPTDAGRALWATLQSVEGDFFGQIFGGISAGESALLMDILERLIRNADAACRSE